MREEIHETIMTGFGAIHIDSWSSGPYKMPVKDKYVLFEDSDRFGPLFVCKNGASKENQSACKLFWTHYERWREIGKPLDGDVCVLTKPMLRFNPADSDKDMLP